MQKAWEYHSKDAPFGSLSVAQQRDELHAAVGLLIEALRDMDLSSKPLMPGVVMTMGHRYGPWSR